MPEPGCEGAGQGLPIVRAEAQRKKEGSLPTVIRVSRVQEVTGDFVPLTTARWALGSFIGPVRWRL